MQNILAWNSTVLILGALVLFRGKSAHEIYRILGGGYMLTSIVSQYVTIYLTQINDIVGIWYTKHQAVCYQLKQLKKNGSVETQECAAHWLEWLEKYKYQQVDSPIVYTHIDDIIDVLKSCDTKPWVNMTNPQIQEFLGMLPSELQASMYPFIYNVTRKERKYATRGLYLYGEPGTGKTHFVHEISRILGLPIVNMHNLRGCWYDVPTHRSIDEYVNYFSAACIQSPKQQFILVMDECEATLQHNDSNSLDFFLQLLGDNKPKFDMALRRAFAKSFVLIVFIANSKLKVDPVRKPKVDAFMDRVECIEFLPKTTAEKLSIARKHANGRLPDDTIAQVVQQHEQEPGVRRILATLETYLAKQDALTQETVF